MCVCLCSFFNALLLCILLKPNDSTGGEGEERGRGTMDYIVLNAG